MGTMVKMYIHVLLVDIHESPLFRKCESDFINKTIKCSNAFKLAVVLFSGHSGFFPQGKNRLRPLRWHDIFVSSVRFGN